MALSHVKFPMRWRWSRSQSHLQCPSSLCALASKSTQADLTFPAPLSKSQHRIVSPAAAKAMVLAAKPTIEDTSSALEPALLGTLFANLGMLASVYQKPPEAFASRVRPEVLQVDSVDAPRAVGWIRA